MGNRTKAIGGRVEIFQDPVTRQKPEGLAQLVSRNSSAGVHDGVEYEFWNVRFIEDGRFGQVCQRVVRKPERVPCGQ